MASYREDKELCPHCSVQVSKKTLLAHKRVYYDCSSDQWIKKRRGSDSSNSKYIGIIIMVIVYNTVIIYR